MVVVSIIVILITIAIPIYNNAIRRANESVLKNNLFSRRSCLDIVGGDQGRAPQSLEELVTQGCFRAVPFDPFTHSSQTWRTIAEDASNAVDPSQIGIFDVRSGSDKIGLDGSRYADW
jgi:general secretion pathway protein G